MKFSGKKVWLTGASSGIGAALAAAFAREGASVLLSGRDRPRLEGVASACREEAARRIRGGGEISGQTTAFPVLAFDLAGREATSAAPAAAREALGGTPDLLVLNAGLGQRGLALETDLAVVERLMNVDFLSAVALARGVLPGMLARGSGRIAVVTSLLGIFGAPRRSAYAAAKHALHGWFDSLRAELHGTGVGVTLLAPGWVRTDISFSALDAAGERHDRLDAGQARGLTPAECARRMLRALEREVDEQYIGGRECLAAYGKRYFPRRFARWLPRFDIG